MCKIDFLKDTINFKQDARTRGHTLSLNKERSHCKIMKNSLINRIFDIWNSFPHDFGDINDLNVLKNFIDKFFADSDLKWCCASVVGGGCGDRGFKRSRRSTVLDFLRKGAQHGHEPTSELNRFEV